MIAAIIVLGSMVWISEGRVPVPGLLGILALVALIKDAKLRRKKAQSTSVPDESRQARHPTWARLVVVTAALAVGIVAIFPPWQAIATRTTTRTNPFIPGGGRVSTVTDQFQWTIPFAPIYDPPSDPSFLEGLLAEGILRAEAGPPGAVDSAIAMYMEQVRRVEARGRIPYHLTMEGLMTPSSEGTYTNRRATFAFEIDSERLALTVLAIGAVGTGLFVIVKRL